MALLLVDDEPAVLASFGRLLRRRLGIDVVTAHDALEAEACLRNHPITVVLSDLRMPGGDGLAVLEAARQIRPQARRALFTAFVDPGTTGDLAHDVIAKDLDIDVLLERVARLADPSFK